MGSPSITSVKQLAESPNLSSIPSNYIYNSNTASEAGDSIPVIDLSLLNSDDVDRKAKAIHDLNKACQDWGFFMVVNHGISEELMRRLVEATSDFFNLAEEEKPEFEPKNVMSPIRYGTSFNTARENIFCWRDFLKIFLHPHFDCPHKPQSLRGLVVEYGERIRGVVKTLLKGVSESVGVEEGEMEKALNMGSTFQLFAANFYPPCPNPDVAMGVPPHSDHGLLTLLIQNQVGGLQIHHQGRWVSVDPLPNSILVNTGDHLEIFSNGRYKSVLHRAVVNSEKTRISIAVVNGPSLDAVVSPAPLLVQRQGCGARYAPMKYRDYILKQQSNQLDGKSMLKRIQVQDH